MARSRNNHNRNNRNNQNNQNNGQNNFNGSNARNNNQNNNNGNNGSGKINGNNSRYNRNGSQYQRNNQNGNGFQGNCRKCGLPGHRAADCRVNTNNQNNSNRVNRPHNKNKNNHQDGRNGSHSSNRWCIWCCSNTHSTETCKYPPPTICEICLKKGHTQDGCRSKDDCNLPIERDANGYCNWCHQPWHAGRECLDRQIEDRAARSSAQDSPSSYSPTVSSAEVIQSQVVPPSVAGPSFQPSNPFATISSQAWAPSVFTANMQAKEHHRHTCDTCTSSTHRTIECASIRPCSACHSPFHSRADCLDVIAAQAFLKPAVTLWQKRPEHEQAGGGGRYCVYCNATGHATEACTNEAALTQHLTSPLRCGQCGKRGHGDDRCLNPTAQWGGPPTLQNLREQDWSRAWLAGWRPACSKCEYAMEVYDVWNGDADVAMGGCVSGRLFIPAHVCTDSVVWWVKME